MKKILILLIMICIITCGCSKEETPAPEPVTEIPTQEITPTTIPTFNTACAVCGRQTDCKEIIRTRYDLGLQRDIDKAFYLCENCYGDDLQDEHDLNAYETLDNMLSIVLTLDEHFEKINGTVTINSSGVKVSPGLEDLLDKLKNSFDDFDTLKTKWEYTIEIKNMRFYTDNKPKSILDTLE